MHKNRPIISFIVPVYNSAFFISNCIDSIAKNPLSSTDFEIIAWDDGSIDNSHDILLSLADKYNQLKVYKDSNHGVSYSRNKALQQAQGKYVWFVDADDKINSEYLLLLIERLEIQSLDLLVFNFLFEEPDQRQRKAVDICTMGAMPGVQLYMKQPFSLVVWRFIYRRDFLKENNLYFEEKFRISEDFYFNYQALFYARRVMSIPIVGYYYIQHASSLVHQDPWQLVLENSRQLKDVINSLGKNFPKDYLTNIVYDRLKDINVRLKFVSEDMNMRRVFEKNLKYSLDNFCPKMNYKGLYITIMRLSPFFLFNSKERIMNALGEYYNK